MKRLYALRGAAQCANTEADIRRETAGLYDKLLAANNLREEDIVSLVFSVTPGLDAKNPAAALREEGRAGELALFVVQEAVSRGMMERVIRALLHCYLEEGAAPVHVYTSGAEALRPERRL